MKLIPLTQGEFTEVDDDDFEFLNQYKWHLIRFKGNERKYAASHINGKRILLHRLLTEATNEFVVDHIEGNGLNNQRLNLRLATHAQNMANRKPSKNGTSKYLGVSSSPIKGKNGVVYHYWEAELRSNNVRFRLGRFKTEYDAANAYNKKAIEIHGQFARLNTFE